MLSERQRIEAAPTSSPTVDSMPPPPSYEEANDIPTSPAQNGATDSMGYFLGEVRKNQCLTGPFDLFRSELHIMVDLFFIFFCNFW